MSKIVRCAIYTRKSSEEGLQQDFNSLAAQREACEAYIKSQAGEGWRALPAMFDDGGYSGGTLERPALQRLLAQIDAGAVDVVVVYKVDRLTRSLLDFSKIVERFEAKQASFVSVTQSFNTTTSMGRLTLNVLLSFAQFEREVTGERIRDKIAASKAKGLWMGGVPPLGYAPNGRTLSVIEEEADIVRKIFQRYLVLKSATAVANELKASGVRARSGTFMRSGPVRHILRNRLYRGEIPHKDRIYPGQHDAIVERAVFDAAQEITTANAGRRGRRPQKEKIALLKRRIFDADDKAMIVTSTHNRFGREYLYYNSRIGGNLARGLRVPAASLDALVQQTMERLIGDEATRHLARVAVSADTVALTFVGKTLNAEGLRAKLASAERLEECAGNVFVVTIPARYRRWRGAIRRFDGDGRPARASDPDPSMLRSLIKGHVWRDALLTGKAKSYVALAADEETAPSYVQRVTRLAYLAPDIARAVLSGAPTAPSIDLLMRAELPRDWDEQRTLVARIAGQLAEIA